ncbi:MAG: hypothetical protein JST22_12995 [Bacteroidetes bacterium]|nr:hypothetical protein [Bacteroidota bacterium]
MNIHSIHPPVGGPLHGRRGVQRSVARIAITSLRGTIAVALLLCASIHAYGQEKVVLSERVGEEISASERAYFGLFPTVEGFRTAHIVKASDSTMRAVISGNDAGRPFDTTITMSLRAFNLLRVYVNEFESLFYKDSSTASGKSIRHLARPVNLFQEDALPLEAEMADGRVVSGSLVYADDSVIVLGVPHFLAYRPGDVESVQVLVPGNILRLHDVRGTIGHMFNDVDLPVGRNAAVYRTEGLDYLSWRAVFYPYPSPELLRAIQKANRAEQSGGAAPVGVEAFEAAHARASMHIGLYYPVIGDLHEDVYKSMHDGSLFASAQVRPTGTMLPVASVEYDLASSLRLGLWGEWISSNAPTDTVRDYETKYGATGLLSLRYLPLTSSRFKYSTADRFDISVGAGLACQFLERDAALQSPGSNNFYQIFTISKTVLGWAVLAGVDYYVSDMVSINLEGRYYIFPTVKSDTLTITHPNAPDLVLASHAAFDIKLSRPEVGIGLRVHL